MDTLTIRLALPADLPAIEPIERSSEELFYEAGVDIGRTGASPDDEPEYAAAIAQGRLLVAVIERRCVGFSLLDAIDGCPHLEELDVHADWQRRGIGRALLLASIEHFRRQGANRVTLSTFRDLPWNGPFYASHGFRELAPEEWTPGLRALREWEARQGLDISLRCVMEKRL
jgi:GNAT superfamily N-acetyltransferase